MLDADGSLDRASIGRCTSPTILCTYEKFYFTPGDLGFQNFETRYSRIGVLVCWDQWYPEGARITSLQGANVLFYPTAIGWHPAEKAQYGEAQLDAWRTIQRAHAIANGVFVAAVNRTGYEGFARERTWSSGAIRLSPIRLDACWPRLRQSRNRFWSLKCDPKQMDEVRRNWPFLRDRRIDAYAPITNAGWAESMTADPSASLGFRMPAEWEPHEATWLAWPHETTDWPGKFAADSRGFTARLFATFRAWRKSAFWLRMRRRSRKRDVLLKKCTGEHARQSNSSISERIVAGRATSVPCLCRNMTVSAVMLNWHFNGWAKYPNSEHDDAVTETARGAA